MIAIIDYDAGNIRNVENALHALAEETVVTREPETILRAERCILPGVGAFGDAMEKLHGFGLVPVLRQYAESGKPFLGICLGLQLLFASSEESAGVPGLGLLPGTVRRLPETPGLKIPHIGWNDIRFPRESRLFDGIADGSYVYFVHSYYLQAGDESIVAATTEYGTTVHAAVEKDNVFACQFHPEKSGDVGMKILKNFCRL
ncbi:MAG: imidazole glycerol phosphate synthase subunit HisH [Lachnospiraceae bacterium]|nr:imidazole glycerol phosphate synthase subunit HisH [Lachnospiraceae bacterium]